MNGTFGTLTPGYKIDTTPTIRLPAYACIYTNYDVVYRMSMQIEVGLKHFLKRDSWNHTMFSISIKVLREQSKATWLLIFHDYMECASSQPFIWCFKWLYLTFAGIQDVIWVR